MLVVYFVSAEMHGKEAKTYGYIRRDDSRSQEES